MSVVFLYLFTNSFLFDTIARQWEVPAISLAENDTYDAGIILGGITVYDEKLERIQFIQSADRLWQAVQLYKKGKIKKLFFTGGSGYLSLKSHKEGPMIKNYLLSIGIPEKDIIIEGESKNTYENAVFSKAILDTQKIGNKILLFTTGIHMRRAIACFEKAGIRTTPYTVDRLGIPRLSTIGHYLIPEAARLQSWDKLIHEWIGYFTYAAVGYL